MWAIYTAVGAVLYLIFSTLHTAGSFKSIHPTLDGSMLNSYAGPSGPEDMDLDDATGTIFISSSNRWKGLNGIPAHDGIYILRPDSMAQPRKLATTYKGAFHPHGISWLNHNNQQLLFVVNHNETGNFVEVFRFRNDSLFHQRSISDSDAMCCPNDVVAVSADKFYVTNDHGTKKGFGRTLEDYLRLPFSSLLYYNGKTFSKAQGGLHYGNGVNVSNDRKLLYVTTTTGQNLLTFTMDTTSGALEQVHKLPLKTGVDNIDVDADGNIWIAAHPKLLAFVGHAKDSIKISPSQVLKISPGDSYKVEEIWMDDGTTLSGSSIALRYNNDVYVGGVFQHKVVRIRLNPQP